MTQRILCWDIDGTLLTTARAGIYAWEEAIAEVLAVEISLQDYPTAGLTDVEIGRLLVDKALGGADDARAETLTRRYGELLPTSLHRRQGGALPGVREILTAVDQRDDVHSILLTGNIAAGARAKLSHYDLDGFFDFGQGAFSDGTPDRPSVARRALASATEHFGVDDPAALFVIGDTPHDIHCADAIEARCVAVATGGYTSDQLAEHRPWWLIEQLPDVEVFLDKILAD